MAAIHEERHYPYRQPWDADGPKQLSELLLQHVLGEVLGGPSPQVGVIAVSAVVPGGPSPGLQGCQVPLRKISGNHLHR